MKFPNKSKIDVAAVKTNVFDVSQQYVGTLDFGNLVPSNWRICRHGESYDINAMSFVRTAPLVVPTFGRVRIVNDTFFVPFHQVFANWENFKTRQSFVNSNGTAFKVTKVPTISNSQILSLLSYTSIAITSTITLDGAYTPNDLSRKLIDHDLFNTEDEPILFDYISSLHFDANGKIDKVTAVVLTVKGKRIFNLFTSLGYDTSMYFDQQDFISAVSTEVTYYQNDKELSVLNFLAFVKIYLDWYQSNQFTNDSSLRKLFTKIATNNYGTQLSSSDLYNLCENFVRCYDQDLYTASYLTPNADTDLVGVAAPPSYTGTAANNVNNASQGAGARGTSTPIIPAINISLAQRLQNYIDRWRVGGKRDIDRDLAEFGVKSKDVDYHRSRLLNTYSQDLAISDVMANTMAENQPLGDYAGKALSYGNSKFHFETGDDGVLMTISCVVPSTGYVHGTTKEMEDIELLDFYTPEFDSVGVEALSIGQLVSGQDMMLEFVDKSSVFGYVPRYAHWKVGHDTLAGDFRIGSLKTGMDSWHLYRQDYGDEIANNESFRKINLHYKGNDLVDNFDRIFAVGTDSAEDHFYLFANFDMKMYAPYRSIQESLLPVYDGESHKKVSVDYNGKQL